jgi:predicted DCC family thiol-disulfide oxidoreductase YuxK
VEEAEVMTSTTTTLARDLRNLIPFVDEDRAVLDRAAKLLTWYERRCAWYADTLGVLASLPDDLRNEVYAKGANAPNMRIWIAGVLYGFSKLEALSKPRPKIDAH